MTSQRETFTTSNTLDPEIARALRAFAKQLALFILSQD
jgi:hypothetical protein